MASCFSGFLRYLFFVILSTCLMLIISLFFSLCSLRVLSPTGFPLLNSVARFDQPFRYGPRPPCIIRWPRTGVAIIIAIDFIDARTEQVQRVDSCVLLSLKIVLNVYCYPFLFATLGRTPCDEYVTYLRSLHCLVLQTKKIYRQFAISSKSTNKIYDRFISNTN